MIKKNMDIVDVYAWVRNNSEKINRCRIDNIYYTRFYWLLKIRCPGTGKVFLKIEPGTRIHLSEIEPSIKEIDKFTAFLRKHIRGGIITNVSMTGWERIVYFDIISRSKNYRLYVEILPRGFTVLTDDNNRILYANRFAELRDRKIKIGEKYRTPPSKINLLETDIDQLIEQLKIGRDLVRGIVKGWGLPGYLAEEVLYRSGLHDYKNNPVNTVDKTDLVKLVHAFKEVLNESVKGMGYIVYSDDEPVLVTPYNPLLFTEKYDVEVKVFEVFDKALDYYFGEYERRRFSEELLEKYRGEIERLKRSLEEQKKLVDKYIEKVHELEKILEIIYNHHELLSKLITCSKLVKEKYGWEHVVKKCKGIERVDKAKGIIYVGINDLLIPLNIRLDIWGNVNELRRKIGEYKRKVKSASEKMREVEERIKDFEKKITRSYLRVRRGIRPRQWFERYHWLITRNGFLVIGGRDAGQNETIVRKYLEPNDIFLHAEIHGAPATVLKTRGKEPLHEDILDAAVIAGCYSRAWKEGFGSIDVFWVKGSQVSKKPPSGEYLSKGAFMVYGRKEYTRVVLRLAIGVEEVCDEIYGVYQRVIIGPEDLVSSRSIVYAVLIPGDKTVRTLAEEIYDLFRRKIEDKHVLSITVDELEYRIPGSSRLLRMARGEKYGRIVCE